MAWLASFKVLYWAILVLAVWLWREPPGASGFVTPYHFPEGQPESLASHFAGYDSCFYLVLSGTGYVRGSLTCAVYPLWPLVVRWFSYIVPGGLFVVSLVLSNVFSLVAWTLLFGLIRARWGARAARWSLVLLVTFPGSLFYQFPCSESLFVLLVVGMLWALDRHRYVAVGLIGILLPLARPIGVFCFIPVLVHVLTVYRPVLCRLWAKCLGMASKTARGRETPDNVAFGSPRPSPAAHAENTGLFVVLPLTPVCGWCIYILLMWNWTGNPFEGFEAQRHWGVHSISNLWNVPKCVAGLFTPTEWHEVAGSVLDRCMFVLLLQCLPVLWRLDKGLLVWTYVLAVLPAMSGTFTSFTRFASCAFPMFIALGVVCGTHNWRLLRYALLAAFVVLHLVLVWRFVNFRWAG
jgi:hypothetical protein